MLYRKITPVHTSKSEEILTKKDWPLLICSIVMGGIIAPVLFMTGLIYTSASSASLLRNLESVFTALLAWFVFKENFDWRILIGMLMIVVGGVVISWEEWQGLHLPIGSFMISAACLC
jgi:drug/metabolite transporter (DMT)-like permease